jgi:hypothetical protein
VSSPGGSYGVISNTEPKVVVPSPSVETRDKILDHSSNEYLALADELEKLEAEELADDDEPEY